MEFPYFGNQGRLMINIYMTTDRGPINGQYTGGGYLDISFGNKWNPLESVNVYDRAGEFEVVERNPMLIVRAMLEWLGEKKGNWVIRNIYITNTFTL